MKENKKIKLALKIVKILLTVILVGFFVVVLLQRFSNNKISFFNFRMFTVISGSMEPKYKIGDVLISKQVKPENIKVGDAISYLGKTGDFKDKVITHEVTKTQKLENGKYMFRARGLTNIIEDPVISEDQLYGKVIYKTFLLSLIYKIIGTQLGFFLFIIIPLMFIVVSEIIMVLLDKEEKRRLNN